MLETVLLKQAEIIILILMDGFQELSGLVVNL